jgi:SulP family sulfate permease
MAWLPKSVVCLRYYDRFRFRSDVLASLTLALQVFPASIAIAIASGLSPYCGALSAALATFVASAFGDSKVRISAPSVLLIPVVLNMVTRHGVLGLSLSTLSAGLLLTFFGTVSFAEGFRELPRALIAGLYTGIASLIVIEQLPNLLGMRGSVVDPGARPFASLGHLSQVHPAATVLGLASLALIVASRRRSGYIPAGLILLGMGALFVRFSHPLFTRPSVSNFVLLSFHSTRDIRPDLFSDVLMQSFVVAVLVSIESVRAIQVASGHAGEHFEPNSELVVEGGVNVAAALAGGLPASGISSFSSQNAHWGAQTPFAGMLQSVLLVGLLLLLLPILPMIPLPIVSALVLAALASTWRLAELRQLLSSDRSEVIGWLIISVLTIVGVSIGIAAGLLIAMYLHIRKHGKPQLSRIL